MSLWKPSKNNIAIASLDNGPSVEAQYNPKELSFDKTITWNPHQKQGAPSDGLQLEFAGSQTSRATSVDFLFDAVEENDPQSVIDAINDLQTLATVQDPTSTDDTKRRPHHCVLTWGNALLGVDRFQCVITQITVKYQMFSTDGLPLRATVTLKLQEATRVMMAPAGGSSSTPAAGGSSGGGAAGGST